MFLYGGRKSKVVKEAPFPGLACRGCQSKEAKVVVRVSYFHIFWVPVFPYNKKLQIICANCNLPSKPKEVSEEVRQVAKQLKSAVKPPIWMFTGVVMISLAITYGIITDSLQTQKNLDMIKNPQVNDVYYFYDKFEKSDYKYTLRKVVGIEGDSLNLSPNVFQYSMKVSYLDDKDGFYDVYLNIHKDQLVQLYENDVIRRVLRDYPANRGFDRELIYPDSLLN